MAFHWVLVTANLCKSPGILSVFWPISTMLYFGWHPLVLLFPTLSHVSKALLSILADLDNSQVWMVSTCHFISKSSNNCINSLVTVSKAPIIIGINITFMFHSFFNSLAKSKNLSFFSIFSILSSGHPGQQSWQFGKLYFFVVNYKVWSSDIEIRG